MPRLIAAVDLGSNSFRLAIARVEESATGAQIYPIDSLKESVRLASGLGPDKRMDDESQARALTALHRFGERIRSFSPDNVRVVGTNTLRVAKNVDTFLPAAEAALGFPIEVIPGREEARLIYNGVAHSVPNDGRRRLVVDIGGGSTEFIIGTDYTPLLMESLFIGCVSFSRQYFPGGNIDRQGFKQAILAARREVAVIAAEYQSLGWQVALGTSGTARALSDLLDANQLSDHGISWEGMDRLRGELVKAGNLSNFNLAGVKSDRIPVLPGGLAIMLGVFEELGLDQMSYADGALRQGVLYELLGRQQHHDMRELTVEQFQRRYAVDLAQAQRVSMLARRLHSDLAAGAEEEVEERNRFLTWAAQLHEIGLTIAHNGYHRHSAYIVGNADMPGFSSREQSRLAALVLGHTGKLPKIAPLIKDINDWSAVLALRIAVLMHRRRLAPESSNLALKPAVSGWQIVVNTAWLSEHPLSEYSLRQECSEWSKVGFLVELVDQ